MRPLKPYSKRTRLKHFDYIGRRRYFITICTHKKQVLFNRSETVENCIRLLDEKSKAMGFKVWAYCFMPDHLHLLLEGLNSNSSLKQFVTGFKQSTGYHYRKAFKHAAATANNHQKVAQGFSPAGDG